MRRAPAVLVALVAAGVLLTGCDSVAPALACKVDVDSPDLVEDREAAGIADCGFDVDTTAPAADLPDLDLDCLGGTTTRSLADVRGPALINFWASNCGPCREELPVLQEFHELYGEQVMVLGVDFLETYPGAAIDLARQSGVTYPSLADACGDLQETDLVVQGLPQFVFVDAAGETRQSAGGVDSLDELVALVDQHLGIDVTAQTPADSAQEGTR